MTLNNKKIAILTANGVLQNDISMIQRALIQKRCFPKIVGAGSKLIVSWDGEQWGHNFAVDVSITEALGVDYDVLIIPGGTRAMDVLSETAHTRRILNSFVVAEKPVVAMKDAESIFKTFDLPATGANIHLMDDVTEETVSNAVTWFENFEIETTEQQAA